MNEIIVLGLLFALLSRFIGLIISIGFYNSLRDKKFIKLVLGWFFWICAGTLNLSSEIINQVPTNDIVILLNTIFSALGDIFVLIGVISYFRKIPNNMFIILTSIFVIGPILAYSIPSFRSLLSVISLLRLFVTIFFTVIPIIERKRFKKQLSNKTYFWFYITTIIIYLYTVSYFLLTLQGKIYGGIINAPGLELIIYLFLLDSTTFLVVILVNQIEYDISSYYKFELKDKYSHDLGNILQRLYTASDLIREEKDLKMLDIIEKNIKEAAELIKEIRDISF